MKSNQVLPERISVVPDVSRKESCCTVVHINMAQPKPVAEATLDMIEIMTRAFDESEGGEANIICSLEPHGSPTAGRCYDPTTCKEVWCPEYQALLLVHDCYDFTGNTYDQCNDGELCAGDF